MMRSLNDLTSEGYLEELHTFDSTYKNVLFRNNNLVIPYINLGLSEHPWNTEDEMRYLDFCYVVLLNVTYLNVVIAGTSYHVLGEVTDRPKLHFGGIYRDFGKAIFNEMDVLCERSLLKTLPHTLMSKEIWRLFGEKDQNRGPQLDTYRVEAFLSHASLPIDIGNFLR